MKTELEFLMNLVESKRFVRDHRLELRGRYGDDYLALSGTTVIDHDPNQFLLMKRVSTGHGIIVYGTVDHLAQNDSLTQQAELRIRELTAA
jgi:hypothetical protein